MSMKIFFKFWKAAKAKLFDTVIDGFKIFVPLIHFSEEFLEEAFPLDVRYGELLNTPKEVDFYGLKLKKFPDSGIRIRGSLHSFFNNGSSNHDHFSFENCQRAIEELCEVISPACADIELKNLEFGLNINTPLVTDILNSALLYKSKPFNWRRSSRMNYGECPMTEQKIKFYDKGLQHSMINSILRLEDRRRTSRAVKSTGITCLNDLFHKHNQQALIDKLIEVSSKITFIDQNLDLDQLSFDNRNFYLEFSNPNRWTREDLNLHQKKRRRIRLNRLQNQYGENYSQLFQTLVHKALKEYGS